MKKSKLLLHSCCAPCLTYPSEVLLTNYDLMAYFYNPNIDPLDEYERRKQEFMAYAKGQHYFFFVEKPDFDGWHLAVIGLENEPEKGKRCLVCFEFRLNQTAKFAAENDFNIFTTCLSISPHKNVAQINIAGQKAAKQYGITFLEVDFKKNDGFRKACERAKQYNLYRQNYCGCKYSMR